MYKRDFNGKPYADNAVALAQKEKVFDRIGIHINLTEGVPLTDKIKKCPLFCDKNGFFNAEFHKRLITRMFLDYKSMECAKEEIGAQFDKFLSYGFTNAMHIDSHHHIHTNRPILLSIESFMKDYSFGYIRISRNMGDYFPTKYLYKKYCNLKIKNMGISTSDFFGSINDFKMENNT